MEGGDAKDYLLATACDEICVPESGWLMLTGVRAEVSFYKDLLDKIGVKADMLRMGDAKSAAEPYTQTKMSDASHKQLEGVLDDYYENSMVGRIVKDRAAKNFTAEQVKKIIDDGPYAAHAAEKAGLIDRVAYKQDLRRLVQEDVEGRERRSRAQLRPGQVGRARPVQPVRHLQAAVAVEGHGVERQAEDRGDLRRRASSPRARAAAACSARRRAARRR